MVVNTVSVVGVVEFEMPVPDDADAPDAKARAPAPKINAILGCIAALHDDNNESVCFVKVRNERNWKLKDVQCTKDTGI